MQFRLWSRQRWSLLIVVALCLLALLLLMRRGNDLLADRSVVVQQVGEGWPQLTTGLEIGGLDLPSHITHAGDGSGRLFVIEQEGTIRIIKDEQVQTEPFLDITSRVVCCGEQGLLSVAFPPDYASKDHFYINYTSQERVEPGIEEGDTVIARYQLTDDPDVADPASEQILLTIAQPFGNHNGGQIAFGPDGYLYVGMGDGGSAGDPQGKGQDPAALLGKMLRLDVESNPTGDYVIPPTNPFTQTEGYAPEIWATGLRNPWRFSFDRQTGDLYIADVGQNQYEEVNFQPASSSGGENYGWNCKEATHDFNTSEPPCDDPDFVDTLVPPVAEYDHSGGCSVTGGFVYRGTEYERMQGVYLYADYCSGRIWGLRQVDGGWENTLLLDTGYNITTFGEDEAGNLYISNYSDTGSILMLVDDMTEPTPTPSPSPLPSPSPTVEPSPEPEPGAITITPEQGTSVLTSDGDLEIDLQVPANAVSSTALLTYTGGLSVTEVIDDLPADLDYLYRFRLEATTGDGGHLMQFSRPFSITITGLDITAGAMGEIGGMAAGLFYRDEQGDFVRCEDCNVVTDQDSQQFILETDRVSEFVLYRNELSDPVQTFLPLLQR